MNLGSALPGLFLFAFVVYSTQKAFRKRERASLRCAAVLVLGDIGRSPRMMYHAESFAKSQFKTYLIGYAGSTPIPSLERLNVQLVHLRAAPRLLQNLPFIVLAPFKVLLQVATLLHVLLFVIPHPPEYIIVQNPPSIPTLAILPIVCASRGCKLIIDWHNLGYSILGLKLGEMHPFVRLAEFFEKTFGRKAFIHLFVTKAMKDDLTEKWNLQGNKVVLHDRPPSHFKRSEVFESHNLFNRLYKSESLFSSPYILGFFEGIDPPRSTPFTQVLSSDIASSLKSEIIDPTFAVASKPTLRPNRPALLVSSTSWTPDEDFGILLDALKQYEEKAKVLNEANLDARDERRLPKLLAIVTGKGPQKKYYMDRVAQLERENDWRWVRCRSLWLEADDYPVLLGAADLGVSLHSSSSGLDLPMKVVDMFGCGLPVCALNFRCLPELVKDGKNGRIFDTSNELASQLVDLLHGFPEAKGLNALRSTFEESMFRSSRRLSKSHSDEVSQRWCSWEENWDRVLKPLLLSDVHRD